ncbi:hypothetical protein K3148_06565 [Qipengyuania aurantiaca]|uniref:DUF4440 domain-containing protein n=1 Tax=Qipengyuania aurantiaca TaxID=2867233 RepID=A0ABX8ZPW5_9SPHN|nr:hypothetical protein [Qipengyuania aurantiaca]QZD91040.1 hypothetical protein K3148_06565 [Qipengyuania aurantiaca]
MLRAAVIGLTLVSLTACTSTGPRTPYGRFMEARANPGKVVATELAFARAAQEDGQWTAFAEYAADGGLLFGRNGAIEAKPWLKAQENPAAAVQWEPHRVWSSCDGSLAVTQGGFVDPEGTVGTFNTVWQRQSDGEYRWVFDFGYPQADAPVKPEMIASRVAECGTRLAPPAVDPGARVSISRDGTLAWSIHFVGGGERRYDVWLAGDEGWERVVDIDLEADRAQ